MPASADPFSESLFFVDSNVFLYAVDLADPRKQSAAREWRDHLWKTRRGRISYQVLNEFYVNATRKQRNAVEDARAEIRDLLAWNPVVVDDSVVSRAWRIQDRFQLSYWDAMIVAAAQIASCEFLLTEDLQNGARLDSIEVINPFQHDPF